MTDNSEDQQRHIVEIRIGIFATATEHARLSQEILALLETEPHASVPWSYDTTQGKELEADYPHLLEQAALEQEHGLRDGL